MQGDLLPPNPGAWMELWLVRALTEAPFPRTVRCKPRVRYNRSGVCVKDCSYNWGNTVRGLYTHLCKTLITMAGQNAENAHPNSRTLKPGIYAPIPTFFLPESEDLGQ